MNGDEEDDVKREHWTSRLASIGAGLIVYLMICCIGFGILMFVMLAMKGGR